MKVSIFNNLGGFTGLLGIVCLSTLSLGEEAAQTRSDEKLPPHTPLTRAIRLEKFEETKTLITPETVKQPDGGGYHPLSYAAYTSHNELMEALLKAGANPNVVEKNGKTPLYITANMANIEGMKILKEHGAKRPPNDALPPAMAAVHSSSVDSLKALVRLFPDVDLSRGWEDHNKNNHWKTVDTQGDPVSYAAYHGYDELALQLLALKARPFAKDFRGQSALHHAAIHPQCSVALVKSLVDVGLSPAEMHFLPQLRYPHMNRIPRTPLDYAALSGSFEKVKVMALSLDTDRHRNVILNAAYIGAAYRQDKVADYLVNLVGEDITLFSKGRHKHGPVKVRSAPSAMGKDELDRIMPRVESRPGEVPRDGSLAIIAGPSLRDGAALLAVKLSEQENIQLVERDQLNAIAAEKGLQGLNNGDTRVLHEALNLIPAKHVVVMSRQKVNEKEYARVVVVDSVSGLVKSTHALPIKAIGSKKAAEVVAGSVMLALHDEAEAGIGVSLTTITSEIKNADAHSMIADLNTLMPHFIANTKGCASLNRDQLKHLQLEKAIGAEGSYWAAAWVVDGGIDAIENGKSELVLRAFHAVDKTEVRASGTIEVDQVDEGLRMCWNELVSRMQGMGSVADGETAEAVKQNALEKESKVFNHHADWLFEAGYYEDAAKLMDASLKLGKKSQNRIRKALMIQLKVAHLLTKKRYLTRSRNLESDFISDTKLTNVGQWGLYGTAFNAQPRSISASFKMELRENMGAFIRLGELAESRIRMKPRHERGYRWTDPSEYDRDIEPTLNPFVSNALGNLLFVATAFDHFLIHANPEEQEKIKAISGQIERITSLYLNHLERLERGPKGLDVMRVKWMTLQYLLARDYDYYSRHFPELHERMMLMMGKTVKDAKDMNELELSKLYIFVANKAYSTKEMGLRQASESWRSLQQVCEQMAPQGQLALLSTAPFHSQPTRADRVQWLEQLYAKPFLVPIGTTDKTAIELSSIGDLIGMDERQQDRIPSRVVECALLEDIDELQKTTEYLRLAPLYRAVDRLRMERGHYVVAFLKRRPELKEGQKRRKSPTEWSQEAWRNIAAVLTKSHELNPEAKDLLNKLSGAEEDEYPLAGGSIDLANAEIIALPEQNGHDERLFYSYPERAGIDGDELWLPGQYSKAHIPWNEVGTHNDNAIQVISLTGKTVRTIILPRKPTENRSGSLLLHKKDARSDSGRVVFTEKHAYYTPAGKHLFCISRDSHKVDEVELPGSFEHPHVDLLATHRGKNMLLVEIKDQIRERNLHQCLLVKEAEVFGVLVSNRRKPPKSPMDRPGIKTHLMEFHGNEAWIGTSANAHAYNLETEKWKKLDGSKAQGMKLRRSLMGSYDYYEKLPHKLYSHFLKDQGGFNIGYWHLNSAYWSFHLRKTPDDVFKRHMIGHVNVIVPSIQHPSFNKQWFSKLAVKGRADEGATVLWPLDRHKKNVKGWWVSPNEAIREGHYYTVIMGKWENYVLIGLKCVNIDKDGKKLSHFYSGEYGLQAIWLVPESTFNAAKKPLKERFDRMINFKSAWLNKQWQHVARINTISSKNDFKIVSLRYVDMAGGSSVLGIVPKLPVKDMDLVLEISPKKSGQKPDFRIEVGDRDDPTEIFNSQKQEMIDTVQAPLPDGTKEIRLINDASKNHNLLLRRILFLSKDR